MIEVKCIGLCVLMTLSSATLPSSFYKPGEGVLKEYWFNYPGSFGNFSYYDTNGFPDCPSKMENMDTFHTQRTELSIFRKNIIYRYRAFYIAPQNGGYQFQGYCNDYCRIFFGKLPADMTKIDELYLTKCHAWTCAEIVPKRSQCEQKPYPSYNLQRSLLIRKDHLPERGCVAISAPIKVFRLDSERFKKPILHGMFHFQQRSGAVLFRSSNCFKNSVPSVNRGPIQYTFCDSPFHYPVQCEHSLS